MLTLVQARATAVEKTLLQLSYKYSQETVTSLAPLLQNPFFLEVVANKPLHLQRLLGMSKFTVEDALLQVYGVEILHSNGECHIADRRGQRLLTARDDCLATVLAVLSQRCQTRYPACCGLDCYSSNGFGWSLDMADIYSKFDQEFFDERVAPYLADHHAADYNHYTETLAAVKSLPPPTQCRPEQRPLWGKFYTALSRIFTIFRGMKRPPPVVVFNEEAERVSLIDVPHHPGKNGRPAAGKEFEQWETMMIRAHNIGGENAEIKTDGTGHEYLSIPHVVDPFIAIGSSWYVLPELPALEPVDMAEQEEEEEHDSQDESVNGEDGAYAPESAKPAPVARPPFRAPSHPLRPQHVDDEFTWLRSAIKDQCLRSIDLNSDKDLRDSGRVGGPLREGIECFAKMSAQAKSKIVRTIPTGQNPLPVVVRAMCASRPLAKFSQKEVGALLLNKLIMSQSQLPVKVIDGEVIVENRT